MNEDRRAFLIVEKLKAGKITARQAIEEAANELKKEYNKSLDNLLWNLGIEEHRREEKEDKQRMWQSIMAMPDGPEKEREIEIFKRGGCIQPCKVCNGYEPGSPCQDGH